MKFRILRSKDGGGTPLANLPHLFHFACCSFIGWRQSLVSAPPSKLQGVQLQIPPFSRVSAQNASVSNAFLCVWVLLTHFRNRFIISTNLLGRGADPDICYAAKMQEPRITHVAASMTKAEFHVRNVFTRIPSHLPMTWSDTDIHV